MLTLIFRTSKGLLVAYSLKLIKYVYAWWNEVPADPREEKTKFIAFDFCIKILGGLEFLKWEVPVLHIPGPTHAQYFAPSHLVLFILAGCGLMIVVLFLSGTRRDDLKSGCRIAIPIFDMERPAA